MVAPKESPSTGGTARGAENEVRAPKVTLDANQRNLPAHDTAAAVAFLEQHASGWREDWFLQVVAIEPDGSIEAYSVAPGAIESLRDWIEARQGRCNLYVCVNPLRQPKNRKATKKDIAALTHLHIDLDPVDGAPLDEERARLRATVELFRPSVIIDSGNGINAYWRLETPALVRGDPAELESLNKRLVAALGGDHCYNLDRVLRLPGTLNMPDARKRAKGRVPVLARVISQTDTAFAPADFASLPPVEPSTPAQLVELAPVDDAALAARLRVVETDPELAKLRRGEALPWMTDTTRSGFDFALAKALHGLHFGPGEIAALLVAYPHGKAAERGEAYINRILGKLSDRPGPKNTPAQQVGLRLVSAAELVRGAGPVDWLVRGFLEAGTFALMFGAAGSYKSFIALDVAVAVATGKPWHGHSVAKQGPVVFVAGEGHSGLARRLQALCQCRNIDPGTLPLAFTSTAVGLGDPESLVALEEAVAQLDATPVLFVIDTVARNYGPADENSTADMNRFVASVDRLRGDAALLAIHHVGHANRDRERGSSVLRGAVDAAYRVEAEAAIRCVKVLAEKMKDAPLPEPFYFTPRTVELPFTDDSGQPANSIVLETGASQRAETASVFYRNAPELARGNRKATLPKVLAAVFDTPGATLRGIAEEIGMAPATMTALLRDMRSRGLVEPERLKLTPEGIELAAALTGRTELTTAALAPKFRDAKL